MIKLYKIKLCSTVSPGTVKIVIWSSPNSYVFNTEQIFIKLQLQVRHYADFMVNKPKGPFNTIV